MRNVLKNRAWHLFLAIAFSSMQSASAHIHLASSHDHDGHDGHDHSHSQVVHAHNVASHHVDVFESGHQAHSSQVVELCQGWGVKYGKCLSGLAPKQLLYLMFMSINRALSPKFILTTSLTITAFISALKFKLEHLQHYPPLTFKL